MIKDYKIINKEGNRAELIIRVPPNMVESFIDSTGKLFYFRVKGYFINYLGKIKGQEGVVSHKLIHDLPKKFYPVNKHRVYNSEDIFMFYFGDEMYSAVKIKIYLYKKED